MRCWQPQGFTAAGNGILQEMVQIGTRSFVDTFLDGTSNSGTHPIMAKAYTEEVYETHNPWYDEKEDLLILRFNDGRVLETYVQAEPWSSGPCTFYAIRDHVTKEPIPETLWSEDQIANA